MEPNAATSGTEQEVDTPLWDALGKSSFVLRPELHTNGYPRCSATLSDVYLCTTELIMSRIRTFFALNLPHIDIVMRHEITAKSEVPFLAST